MVEIKELMYDTIFKAVFIRRQDILVKMIKDIFEIQEDEKNPLVIIGYESAPLNKNGKTNRADILIKLSDNSYVSIEINKRNSRDIISRNIIQMSRIYAQINMSGQKDNEIKNFVVKGLDINTFPTFTGKPVERIALCEIETGKIVSYLLSFCNIDVVKCSNMLYNVDVKDVSKNIRWGAILTSRTIENISRIIGDDLLSMEKKKEFIDTIKEVNSDEKILEDWMWEEHYRLKELDYENTAKERDKLLDEKAKHLKNREEKLENREEKLETKEEELETKEEELETKEEELETKENNIILKMIKEDIDYNTISKITGKRITEIKEIEKNC